MPRTLTIFLLTLLLVGPAIPAGALDSTAVSSPRATVSLVSDTDAVAPGTPFRIGLHVRLAPGWHTYWKNPGDAGAPTGAGADPAARRQCRPHRLADAAAHGGRPH